MCKVMNQAFLFVRSHAWDRMVNNAGIGPAKPARIHDLENEDWEKVMAVNADSVFLGCKYAIAQMLAQEPHASGHRGWIVNTSSIAALIGIQKCRQSNFQASQQQADYLISCLRRL